MLRLCILHSGNVLALTAIKPQLCHDSRRIRQQTRLECRVGPCLCHHQGPILWPNAILIGVDDLIQGSGIDQTLLRQQCLEGLDAQSGLRRQNRVVMVMIVVVVVMMIMRLVFMSLMRIVWRGGVRV